MMDKLRASKKGIIVFRMIVVVICGALVLTLCLSLFYNILIVSEETAYNTRCRASLLAYSKLNSLPFGSNAADNADIECPTKFLTIEKGSRVAMQREVADQMYFCWNNFGQGRIQLFQQSDTKFCAICSVMQFEDRAVKIDRFLSFLRTENIPERTSEGFAPTYYEFISGIDFATMPPDDLAALDSVAANQLDGSKRYVVMFTFYQESFWNRATASLRSNAPLASLAALPAVGLTMMANPAGPLILLGIGAAVGGHAVSAGLADTGWDARLFLTEYDATSIGAMGCDELPVSMIDARFR